MGIVDCRRLSTVSEAGPNAMREQGQRPDATVSEQPVEVIRRQRLPTELERGGNCS
jgi:hypothetical protein